MSVSLARTLPTAGTSSAVVTTSALATGALLKAMTVRLNRALEAYWPSVAT